ncbi:MAG: hypothetical protein KKA81_05830 [Bacteroidetes bacterium]|nr:hypothetical protein [Bacteroidota bacterium]
MAKKVLFIDETHPLLVSELQTMGYHCEMFSGTSVNDILGKLHEYCGVIIRSKYSIDKEFIDKAENLEFIARAGSGMENIDLDYAASKGIHCLNSPEGNRDAVGEHTLGLLLALLNRIHASDREVRNGLWKREENRGLEIKGKTIAIIGYGNMGSAFAQRLAGFEARVIAYDKYKSGFSSGYISEASMDDVFALTDILSLHVPLNHETEYMVNDKYLNKFAKPVFLINTSRGKVVDTASLVRMLQSGKVRGAALDVLEYESLSFESLDYEDYPEPFRFLSKAENVVLTPHVAGWTVESKEKLALVLAEKIRKIKK